LCFHLHLDDYKFEIKVVKSEKLTYLVVCELDTLQEKTRQNGS